MRLPLVILAAAFALLLPGIAFTSTASPAQAQDAFTLPPLPYEPSALEPVSDTETMTIHHD